MEAPAACATPSPSGLGVRDRLKGPSTKHSKVPYLHHHLERKKGVLTKRVIRGTQPSIASSAPISIDAEQVEHMKLSGILSKVDRPAQVLC